MIISDQGNLFAWAGPARLPIEGGNDPVGSEIRKTKHENTIKQRLAKKTPFPRVKTDVS